MRGEVIGLKKLAMATEGKLKVRAGWTPIWVLLSVLGVALCALSCSCIFKPSD